MNQQLKQVDKLIQELRTSHYMVVLGEYEGLFLEGSITEDSFTIQHNLGGFSKPTKHEALQLFSTIEECFKALCEFPEFKEFIGTRKFISELYVFSGQMDFSVAVKNKTNIEWRVELD